MTIDDRWTRIIYRRTHTTHSTHKCHVQRHITYLSRYSKYHITWLNACERSNQIDECLVSVVWFNSKWLERVRNSERLSRVSLAHLLLLVLLLLRLLLLLVCRCRRFVFVRIIPLFVRIFWICLPDSARCRWLTRSLPDASITVPLFCRFWFSRSSFASFAFVFFGYLFMRFWLFCLHTENITNYINK